MCRWPARPTRPSNPSRQRIAEELGVRPRQVAAAVELLDGGATVPFIARYRKEATGGLDDAQLRTLEERLRYLRELEERRAAVLESIARAGQARRRAGRRRSRRADTKARLEDIYLPYKPKRRTKAQIAREAGPRAAGRRAARPTRRSTRRPTAAGVRRRRARASPTPTAALDGARAILTERFAEDADLIGELRERMWSDGPARSPRSARARRTAGAKFADYFDFAEPFTKLPSHRILAMFRGEKEEVLDLTLEPDGEPRSPRPSPTERAIARRASASPTGAARPTAGCRDACRWAWRTRILRAPAASTCGCGCGRRAEDEARRRVRRQPARPAARRARRHPRRPWASTPASAPACKVAVVDATGKVVATDTIYPHEPRRRLGRVARRRWPRCAAKHKRRADRDRQRHRLAARPTSSPAS